jgi:hypothetical protein
MSSFLYAVVAYQLLILMLLMVQYNVAVGTNMQQLRRQHDTETNTRYKNHNIKIEKEFAQSNKLIPVSQRRYLGMSKYYNHDMPALEGNNTSTTDQQPANEADSIQPTRSPFKSAKETNKVAPIAKGKLIKKKKSKDDDMKGKLVNKKQMIGSGNESINVKTSAPTKVPNIETSNAPEGNIKNVKSMSTKKMEKGKSYFVERTRTPITAPSVLPNNMNPEAVSPVHSMNITFAPYVTAIPPTHEPVNVVPLTPAINNITSVPTSNPSSVDEEYVSIPEYYIAFAAPMADREPTFDEYNTVTQFTTSYFEEIFNNTYNNGNVILPFTFVRIENYFLTKQYQMNIPTSVYNIYMTFNTTFVFAVPVVPSNNNTTTTIILPDSQELLSTMDEAIGANYVMNYIQTSNSTTTTPFDLTLDAVLNPIDLPVSTNRSNDPKTSSEVLMNNNTASSSSSSISSLEGRFILPTGIRITNRTFPHDG